jgi:hypothetical protein
VFKNNEKEKIMNLSKQIIHKQVQEISNIYYSNINDIGKKLSYGYTILAVSSALDISLEESYDTMTDGKNDLKIDALHFTEPSEGQFNISLFQTKYSQNFDKDGGFKENDIIGIISTLRNLFGNISQFDMQINLETKLNEIHSYLSRGNMPTVTIYLVNNGKRWEENGEKQIESFLSETPMNKELFEFVYINHDDILSFSKKEQNVNCMLNFNGKFIDEELNFKRALIGTVPVKNIADIMEQHHSSILKQNVREFLGNKGINQNIKNTLEDQDSRKNFYFLNNGITIVCSNVGYAPSTTQSSTIIKLTNAQIINGGQTSKTIQNVLNDESNKDEDFSQTSVLVRIYKVDEQNYEDDELIDKITLATNSQNAVKLADLRANDEIQKKIEFGLSKYNINYIRKRDFKRAKKGDVRKEIIAQVILAAILQKPNEAKYKKALHFGILYNEIFVEKNITIPLLILLSKLFVMLETKRKTIDSDTLKKYPFISYATDYILMIIYSNIKEQDIEKLILDIDGIFNKEYISSLNILKEKLEELNIDINDSLSLISTLKSDKLNGEN